MILPCHINSISSILYWPLGCEIGIYMSRLWLFTGSLYLVLSPGLVLPISAAGAGYHRCFSYGLGVHPAPGLFFYAYCRKGWSRQTEALKGPPERYLHVLATPLAKRHQAHGQSMCTQIASTVQLHISSPGSNCEFAASHDQL